MITIIGTGHIFDLSDRIHTIIQRERPDIVAVELDRRRQAVLEMDRRNRANGIVQPLTIGFILKPSPMPFRFRILSYVQRKLAAMNNVFPGEEMLSAMDAARTVGAKIALIDRDINKTLTSLNQAMKGREKLRFYTSLIAGLTGIGVKKQSIGTMSEEMETKPGSMIEELGQQFPGLKRALIDERDLHMAMALRRLEDDFPRVIAFVGDAHLEGMKHHLDEWGLHPDVLHLNSLLKEPVMGKGALMGNDLMEGPGDSFMNDSVQERTDSVNIRIH